MKTLVASGSCSATGPGPKPPSSATSRGFRRLFAARWRCRAAGRVRCVSRPWWAAGSIKPRAPRRVFSVTSASRKTQPNSVGARSSPLRIGRASGSAIDTKPVGDLLPGQALGDLPGDLLGEVGQLVQALGGALLGARAAAAGAIAQPLSELAGLADRPADQLAGLTGQLQHDRLALTGPPRDGAADRAQLLCGAARTIAHPTRRLCPPGARPCAPHAPGHGGVSGQSGVAAVAHVGLHNGGIDPHRPPDEMPLAGRLVDHCAGDLVDDLGTQAARQLADRRLVRHPLAQRDPAEAAQANRVRDLPDQRLIAPPSPRLDHHHPHVAVHRDRRSPGAARADRPCLADRREQRRIVQQHVQRGQISR